MRSSSIPSHDADHFTPTVYLYDNFPGGVGLSEPLFRRQAELLQRARELVLGCDCKAGCPGCVGPALEADEHAGRSPRSLAAEVLDLLLSTVSNPEPKPEVAPRRACEHE